MLSNLYIYKNTKSPLLISIHTLAFYQHPLPSALRVVTVDNDTVQAGSAGEASVPCSAAALGVENSGNGSGQSQDAVGRALGGRHDVGRWVGSDHAREDGGVDDEEVVGTPDLSVDIDNSGATVLATVVIAQLVSANPMVGTTIGSGHKVLQTR